jgi:D-psicose/D-tagatose/L-ribulose 3-epimerase
VTDLSRRSVLCSLSALAVPAFSKAGRVELGVCGRPEDFVKADTWGFDYYEPGAAAIAEMSDAAFATYRDRLLASRLRCRSFNSLIRTMKVVGADVNLDAVAAYLDSTLERCRQLGAKVAVWGSASSRNVPEGYAREEGWTQIKTFLRRAGDIAKSKQIVIGIEPLRKQESNIINTGAEALRLVHEVNHPHVKMIIDYYHMRIENEDPEIVRTAREHIVHMHFANPSGRRWPRLASEDPMYSRFFQIVKEVGYSGGLSIEGSGKFEDDAEASLKFFNEQLG